MGGRHLVLDVAGPLVVVRLDLGSFYFIGGQLVLDPVKTEEADEIGKTLVEPEVLPPLESNQVPVPHVRQLMQDHLGHNPDMVLRGLGLAY